MGADEEMKIMEAFLKNVEYADSTKLTPYKENDELKKILESRCFHRICSCARRSDNPIYTIGGRRRGDSMKLKQDKLGEVKQSRKGGGRARGAWVWVAVALMVVVVVAGCVGKEKKVTPSDKVELFFKDVNISIDETPLLNQPVGITATARLPTVNISISNATIGILLPEGFELVSGNLKWQGDLQRNETIVIKAIIKAIKVGDWAIQFLAVTNPPEKESIALETKFLYVSVSETGAEVSNTQIKGVDYKGPKQTETTKTITEEQRG